MSRASLAGAGDHEVRRLVRTLVRGVRALDLRAELDAAHLSWERAGPWDVRLFVLDAPVSEGGVLLFGASEPHWLLAVRARDERARWEHLPALLGVLRVPPGTRPLVAPADTPAGEALWWGWRPGDARVRRAPDKPGRPALAAALDAVVGAIQRTHAALRAREADQAAAREAAEARARLDVEEAAQAFRPARVVAPWSEQLAHPEPAPDEDACSACGMVTWDECGFELATFTGPGRWRGAARRAGTEALRLCPDCQADTGKLLAELYTRAAAGCCLHVVADDNNLDDDSIAFVQGVAREQGHTFCALIADRYAALGLAERRALNGLGPVGSPEDDGEGERPEVCNAPSATTRPPARAPGSGLALVMLLGLASLAGPGPDDDL